MTCQTRVQLGLRPVMTRGNDTNSHQHELRFKMAAARTAARRRKAILLILLLEEEEESHKLNRTKWVRSWIARREEKRCFHQVIAFYSNYCSSKLKIFSSFHDSVSVIVYLHDKVSLQCFF